MSTEANDGARVYTDAPPPTSSQPPPDGDAAVELPPELEVLSGERAEQERTARADDEARKRALESVGTLVALVGGFMAARIEPSMPLTEAEHKQLVDASVPLLEYYGWELPPPWNHWAGLGLAVTLIYVPRAAARRARQDQATTGAES